MRLAEEEITIRLGNESVHLRPTLRAALRLERRYGGFDNLVRAVADGSLAAIADVIWEASSTYTAIPEIIGQIGDSPFRMGVERLTGPIVDFIFVLAGVDPHADTGEADASPRATFAEHHARLYRIATGWLGWSPDEAMRATKAEIIEAQKGRIELLQAIFGGSEESKEAKPSAGPITHSEAEIATGMAKLISLTARGANRAA